QGSAIPRYHTFVCTSVFIEFEERFSEIVAVDSNGHITGKVVDFFDQERKEMYEMTRTSEISHNVWLGPSHLQAEEQYDILIECSDLGRLNPGDLRLIASKNDEFGSQPYCVDFPSSGSILPPTWSQQEADDILDTCKWIYHLAHGS